MVLDKDRRNTTFNVVLDKGGRYNIFKEVLDKEGRYNIFIEVFDKDGRNNVLGMILVFAFCCLYALSVTYLLPDSYYVYSTPVISYEKDFSILRSVLCVLINEALFVYTCTVKTDKTIIDYGIRFLYIFYCLPTIMSFCLFSHRYFISFFICFIVYWLILCFACKNINIGIEISGLSFTQSKVYRSVVSLIMFGGFVYYIVSSTGNFSFSITLDDVYETRALFKEGTNDIIVFLKSALGGFLFPCLIVSYIRKRNKALTILFTFLQLIMFSLAKDKAYLFLVLAAYGFAFFFKMIEERNRSVNTILAGGCAITALSLFGVLENLLYNIIVRRFFVIPSWLNYVYYDYFYNNPKIWWRQDTFLIDKLFTPVYSDSVPVMIGKEYFGSRVTNPNAGMFAEAFSRCGYLGIIIYPLLLAFLLNLMQSVYKDTDKSVLIMMAFTLSISLENDIITSTSFVFVFVIILAFSFAFKNTGGELR